MTRRIIRPALLVCLACLCLASRPTRADTAVVFNEIMYHPATNEAALEWIEFYNQNKIDVDLSGWRLSGGVDYAFPEGTILRGGSYLVVASSPTNLAAGTGLTNVLGPFTGRLSNSGETLTLRNNSDRIVNQVAYSVGGDWPVAPDGAGPSLAKLDPDTANRPDSNWATSTQVGGTPGLLNFPAGLPARTLVFNEISGTQDTNFFVEVLNAGSNTVSLTGHLLVLDAATNRQFALPSVVLAPGHFLTFNTNALGFKPATDDKLYLIPPASNTVHDAVLIKSTPACRWPDGGGEWLTPTSATPGTNNHVSIESSLVINEILYHHQRFPATNGLPPQPSPEEWIEIFNRGTNAVNLTGWKLRGGVSFSFPANKMLGPGQYLVVAADATTLAWTHPAADIVGNFSGQLRNSGDTVILSDPAGNPADKVRYYTFGRWPEAADGGGSSLELRDPNADNSRPEAWAASNESSGSAWQVVSYQAVAQTPLPFEPTTWQELHVGLLGEGECLLDDISVIENPTTSAVQFVGNGNFEAGANGWRLLGNHGRSAVVIDPENPSNHVLHLRTTGVQEHLHNHVESTFLSNLRLTTGRTYAISFRARWISGNRLLNTRLFFNQAARTTELAAPMNNGTPGAPNSTLSTNLGPTFIWFEHKPVIPAANQAVTVVAQPQDSAGVSSCTLFWSTNGTSFSSASMTFTNSWYQGSIPGFPAGRVVQFYVQATDSLGATAAFPARGPQSGALYMVQDGRANSSAGHNLRLIFTPANWSRLRATTNLMSNDPLPCTVVYNETRPYYDMAARLKGSQSGRPNDPRVSFNLKFQADDLFRGVHPVMLLDCSGPPSDPVQQQEILAAQAMLRAGGIPVPHADMAWCIPSSTTSAAGPGVLIPRHEDEFLETAFADGPEGTEWGFELIYSPTTTNSAGYKLPNPQTIAGIDIQSLGTNAEKYRYNFLLKHHHDVDDFGPVMTLGSTLDLPSGPLLEAQSRLLLDISQWQRTFAMVSLWGESDWYSFGNPHNLILYQRPEDGRFVVLPTDVEHLFYRALDAPLIGSGDNSVNWTDVQKLPGNRRLLYAHAQDLIARAFNTNYLARWAAHFSQLAPGQDFSSMLPDIQARSSAALAEIASRAGNAPFALLSPNPLVTASNLVTLTGTAPVEVQSILINGVSHPVTWTSLSNWTVHLVVTGATMVSVSALDLNGILLSNYSASLSVSYTGQPPDPAGAVIFNEILYQPEIPGASWIELRNTSPVHSFDLTGWRINGLDYTFPAGTALSPGSFLVLVENATSFIRNYGVSQTAFDVFRGNLQTNGETLTLLRPGSIPGSELVVDKVRFGASAPWPSTPAGHSLQVIDGTADNSRVANWAAAIGTPGAANATTASQPLPPLWINEIQAENLTGPTNLAGLRTPWLELYNSGTNLLSLSGCFLTLHYTNLAAWPFPDNAVIHPGEFKVVFMDGQTNLSSSNQLHSGLTLPASAGTVALTALLNGQPRVLDFVQYTNLPPDRSHGSLPDGQVFDRQDFFYVTAGATNNGRSGPLTVAINEWMAANTRTLVNPVTGKYGDWFELHNYGTNPANLAGFYLTDVLTNRTKFLIPPGYVIPAGGYLLVWADEKNTNGTPDLHVNFKMSKSGESLGLFGGDGIPVSFVNYGPQVDDVSEGRFPDGAAGQRPLAPATPRASNRIPNSPPHLDPIPDLAAYFGQTVQLATVGSDPDGSLQSLTYSLEPGAPVGAFVNPGSGVFVWATTNAAAPGAYPIGIRVTDNGNPALSAVENFTVAVLAAPQLSFGSVSGQALTLVLETAPGQQYQLQYQVDLDQAGWIDLGAPMQGTGATVSIEVDLSAGPRRFYRVQVQPTW